MARNFDDRGWRDHNETAQRVLSYETPPQLRRFRASMVLLVSSALVAGLWTGLWFAASAYVRAQVSDFVAAQEAQGGVAAYEAMELSGFPSRIVLSFVKPSYVAPPGGSGGGVDAGDALAWRADALTLSARPWWPWQVHGEAPGRHVLEMAGGRFSLSGKVARLSADVELGKSWPESLNVELEGVDLQGGAPLMMDALSVALTHDGAVKASGDGLTLKLSGANLTLPLGGGWGLGNRIENIDAALRVVGPVNPDALLAALPEALSAWRDVGGALEIERLKLRAGSLAVAAVGTLALDGDLQPIGAFTAKFEGLFQVLESFRTQGLVRDGDAVLATMALAALSKRPANGGPSAINLAVSVQDGTLTLGAVPVMKLPRIEWGGAVPMAEGEAEAADEEAPVRDYKNGPAVY